MCFHTFMLQEWGGLSFFLSDTRLGAGTSFYLGGKTGIFSLIGSENSQGTAAEHGKQSFPTRRR